jgi:putative ABC transport system ATP-binding protein
VSGSGKTTLLNILAGLLTPTRGEVHLDETALFRLSEAGRDRFRAQHVGYVFQNHNLLNALTALENVIMPMMFAAKLPPQQRRPRARRLLEVIGLGDAANRHPAQLSAGQRMRVAVARALANRPEIMLADEPTAALDQDSAHVVMDLIQQTCREEGASLLVASHDPALACRFDAVVHLRAGSIEATRD